MPSQRVGVTPTFEPCCVMTAFCGFHSQVIFHTNSSTNAELQWLLSVVESTPLMLCP